MVMDTVDLAEQCENLMNVVVETRKQFGKQCVEYSAKASIIEHKLFDSYLESISKRKFKSKTPIPEISVLQISTAYDDFDAELNEHVQRIENLRQRTSDTANILNQMRRNEVGTLTNIPLTKESILEFRKKRQEIIK